jgi:hypothetical protein
MPALAGVESMQLGLCSRWQQVQDSSRSGTPGNLHSKKQWAAMKW